MQHLFYNPDLKQKYLDENPTSNKASMVFKNFKKYESEENVDLAEMSRETIIRIMNDIAYTEPNTAKNAIYAINSYKKWCCSINVPRAQECYPTLNAKTDLDFVGAIQNKLYSSFDEFYDELRGFYDFKQGDEAAPALCLFWLGFSLSEICNLKTEFVDLNNRNIYDSSGHILVGDIDPRIIEIFKIYKDTKAAVRTQHWDITVYQLEAGYFMHKMVSKNSQKKIGPIRAHQISNRITAAAEESYQKYRVESKISSASIAKSGALHRLYQLETIGKVDFQNRDNKSLIERAYGSSGFQFADIIFQYECYKKAFHL